MSELRDEIDREDPETKEPIVLESQAIADSDVRVLPPSTYVKNMMHLKLGQRAIVNTPTAGEYAIALGWKLQTPGAISSIFPTERLLQYGIRDHSRSSRESH